MTLLITIIVTTFEIMGVISAIVALFYARTSQGAIAWIVSLISIPFIAVPLFWIFGRTKFHGYIIERQTGDSKLQHIIDKIKAKEDWSGQSPYNKGRLIALEELAKLPYTHGNKIKLLIDGENTFDDIFAGLEKAEDYILIQFFIVHDDIVGKELKKRLIHKAKQGVTIYFLYDEIGCNKLPEEYWDELYPAKTD